MADPVGKPSKAGQASLASTPGVRSVDGLHAGQYHEAPGRGFDVIHAGEVDVGGF